MNTVVKKLTINIDADVYQGLQQKIGRGKIGKYLSDLARSRVVGDDIDVGYRAMAKDARYNRDANEWVEGLIGDE